MAERRGFTLLEVLLALAVLAGISLLAFRIMSGAVSAEARSEDWLSASLLGERQLRQGLTGFPEIGETDGRFPAPDDRFSWRQTVVQAMHRDAREVHLVVTWRSDGTDERLELSGLAVR